MGRTRLPWITILLWLVALYIFVSLLTAWIRG